MGRGRAFASGLAIALAIGLCGACSSGSSKPSGAAPARSGATTKEIAATHARVVAAKRRLAVAKKRVTAQHRAFTAAIRKQAHPTSTTPPNKPNGPNGPNRPTTTTKPPAVKPPPTRTPTTTAPTTPLIPVASRAERDLAAVQRTLRRSNAAFRKSVVQGIAYSASVNYYVTAGLYTAGQCAAFEAAQGDGAIADSLAVRAGSVRPAPGWLDSRTGTVPRGRIYEMTVHDTQTIVETGETRVQSFSTHFVVGQDGRARLFLRCA